MQPANTGLRYRVSAQAQQIHPTTLKSHIFPVRNFRGNKFSREFIFTNDILKKFAYFARPQYLGVSRELGLANFREFRGTFVFQDISREQIFANFANGTFFENFAGRKFREFREFTLFRENKFQRKSLTAKI